MATELGSASTAEKGPGPWAYLSSKAHRKPSEGRLEGGGPGRPPGVAAAAAAAAVPAPPLTLVLPLRGLQTISALPPGPAPPLLRILPKPFRAAPGQQFRSSQGWSSAAGSLPEHRPAPACHSHCPRPAAPVNGSFLWDLLPTRVEACFLALKRRAQCSQL